MLIACGLFFPTFADSCFCARFSWLLPAHLHLFFLFFFLPLSLSLSLQVVVCNVYRKLFCAYIPQRHRQISFYQFHRDSVGIAFSITLHFDGAASVSVLDNVIVVHSLASKLVLLYDIEEEDHTYPVVAPLPLAPFSSNR
jgi:hypothetical protein